MVLQMFKKICLLVFVLMVAGCNVDLPQDVAEAYQGLPDKVSFNMDVKPIISDKCYHCHGPDVNTRGAELRLDEKDGLYSKSANGNFPFVPKNLNKSEAIHRILSDDPEYMMPPPKSNRELNNSEKATLVKWVEQGAEWNKHWSFVPLGETKVPEVDTEWTAGNEIDNFVYRKLQQVGLTPSEQADKKMLLRRVTMDLTGLPPTLEELNAFMNDTSPEAYDKVVDRLLGSKSYAERMTLEWLDLARYADSHGFHSDGLRDMWPWRDWVINAFDNNMPYDEFVTEQLAGDLMPNVTKDKIVATAFNRNHPMTAEGGAIEEEFQAEYVFDRTNTFGTAFLGLTIECARCHDHKFDPISQKEYYSLTSFFNNIKELGMTGDDGDYGPLVLLSDSATDEKIKALDERINKLEDARALDVASINSITDFIRKKGSKSIVPILYHPFDKTVKGEKSEYVDGRKKTTLSGKVDFVEGISGLAPKFDHQDDAIQIDDFGKFESTDPFSIALWVNPESRSDKTSVLIGNAHQKNTMFRGWDFYIDSVGHVAARLISSLPHNYIHVRTQEEIPVDEWTHLTMTYDGSARGKGIQIYMNGKPCGEQVVYDRLYKSIKPVNMARTLENRGLRMGKSYRAFTGDNGIFRGMIDELAFYDVSIPENQIESVYSQSSQGKKPIVYDVENVGQKSTFAALEELRKQRLSMVDTIRELMVMEELPVPKPAFVLNRGVYDQPMEQVEVGTPEKVMGFSSNYPSNRYGLSQWLFDKRNPLTARVAVNRYWQMIFGTGLVSTVNDFGNQGALPSHPELLDWLAKYFMNSGWNVKALIRLMVTSNTYKQSSKSNGEMYKKDPENKWLARTPSYRWQAEFIRDNALAASDLLNTSIGGESSKPYQPDGLWIELGNFSHFLLHYKRDEDWRQYRRSMYTFIRRTAPPPYMTIFDAPNREVCTVKRENTNTPLQALVLLNDPQFVEASKALAWRLKNEAGNKLQDQIQLGFQLVLTRDPSMEELNIMEDLYRTELTAFQTGQSSAREFLEVGDFKIKEDQNMLELAALTVVSNTLFNMDEAYMKR